MNGGAGMGIVKDYKIGNTSVKISDDYCSSKSDEEVERILHRIAVSAYRHFNAKTNNADETMINAG